MQLILGEVVSRVKPLFFWLIKLSERFFFTRGSFLSIEVVTLPVLFIFVMFRMTSDWSCRNETHFVNRMQLFLSITFVCREVSVSEDRLLRFLLKIFLMLPDLLLQTLIGLL